MKFANAKKSAGKNAAQRAIIVLLLTFAAFFPAPAQNREPVSMPTPNVAPQPTPEDFELRSKEKNITTLDALAKFEPAYETVYQLGEGDEISVETFDHADLTAKHTIGPDGAITMPLVGPIYIVNLTREEAATKITKAYDEFYNQLAITVRVDRYVSNRVYILGRVSSPGAIQFDTPPTLLEAIMRAGGLPVGGTGSEKAALTRLAVFRGRDQVVWIELKKLLTEGNLALNIRLKRNDLIYIPDSDDQLVYVLGEVNRPGAYHLTPDMTFLDLLGQGGGATKDGSLDTLYVVRPKDGTSRIIDLKKIVKGNQNLNVSLEEGDVLYVPERKLAKFNYVIEKISPFFSTLFLGKALSGF